MDWARPLRKNFSTSLSTLLMSSLGTDPLMCGLGFLNGVWTPVGCRYLYKELFYIISGYGICCKVSFSRYMYWKQREVVFSKEKMSIGLGALHGDVC